MERKEEEERVGVTFLEKVDPCLLADPFVISGWVGKELGTVESVKVTCTGLVIFVCVSSDQRELAREHLKLKIPGVCDARCLVQIRPGGEHGPLEFWVRVSTRQNHVRIYQLSC